VIRIAMEVERAGRWSRVGERFRRSGNWGKWRGKGRNNIVRGKN
jgi:hypothetical protein